MLSSTKINFARNVFWNNEKFGEQSRVKIKMEHFVHLHMYTHINTYVYACFATTDEISRDTISFIRYYGRVIPRYNVVCAVPQTRYPDCLFIRTKDLIGRKINAWNLIINERHEWYYFSCPKVIWPDVCCIKRISKKNTASWNLYEEQITKLGIIFAKTVM